MRYHQRYTLIRPVFFIGCMGAGKTTLARKLARECGLAALDIDRAIERRTGCDAKDILLHEGQTAFAELEAQELERCLGYCPLLIACGGNLVAGARSREIIATSGFTVYIRVCPEESYSRISNHSSRPFFESIDSVRRINTMLIPHFEALADVIVESDGKTAGAMVFEIKTILLERGILCPVSR